MEAIQFEHVSFQYPGHETYALEDISFTVKKSKFVVVCGRSGCGKSTLLRHVKKSMMPYGTRVGNIFIEGQKVEELKNREAVCRVGFVQQNPENQIVTDKVWHELAFGLESLGLANEVIQKKVAEMASFFGIQTWFHKDTKELSGGQKQLLNLAAVMVMQPEIVVLDEPTAQLDPIASKEFLDVLYKINQELGTTIVISEHRLEEVFPMADWVVVIEKGKLLVNDTPRQVGEFLSRCQHDMTYGLPTAMKLYSALGGGGTCPLTVREGKKWLGEYLERHNQLLDSLHNTKKADITSPKQSKVSILKLEDIWFRYSKKEPDVLKNLNLQVNKGELFCVVGGNGVGKSTMLKLIGGFKKSYRGRMTIGSGVVVKNGKECGRTDISIGVLPQNPQALFTEITVREDLQEALYGQRISESDEKERVDGMLKQMQLQHLSEVNPYDLSGGEQQRLALGKVLLNKPQILLLDEPTKGLDPFFKRIFARIMKELTGDGITVILVTHDIEFCAEYADRCAMFFDGTIVSCQEAKEFFRGNYFYTTTANRIASLYFEQAVTYQEVLELCQMKN